MSISDIFIVPEAAAQPRSSQATVRQAGKGGIRLGVLDNSKGNADHLLRMLIEGVRAAMPIGALVSLRKPNSAAPAEPALLDQLVAQTDFVVSAMAD